MSENDPQQASKKERFQKTRRRWSRKDTVGFGHLDWQDWSVDKQKQRKRAKAALDPSLTMTIPPIALHLDYMSSECSSPGEDSEGEEIDDGTKLARSHRWAQQIAIKAAQAPPVKVDGKEWGQSQGEKVLEIRTPRWRSHAVSGAVSHDGILAEYTVERDIHQAGRDCGWKLQSSSRTQSKGVYTDAQIGIHCANT